METKVHIVPEYNKADRGDGGIRRVVEAQLRYLQKYGVTVVTSPDAADVLVCHGTALTVHPGKPVGNHNHGLYWAKHDWAPYSGVTFPKD